MRRTASTLAQPADPPAPEPAPSPAERTYARAEPGALRVPHDPTNEAVVIAAACRSAERRRELVSQVPVDHFHGKGHVEVWAALRELDERGLAFSLDTVKQLSAGAVDVDQLARLIELRAEDPPNLGHHLDMLRWDAQRVRAAQGPFAELNEQLKELSTPPELLAATARRLADDLAGAGGSASVEDSVALLAQNRSARAARKAGSAIYPYGLDGFERRPDGTWRVKHGAAPRELTTVTGVSGSCKSVVAKRVALAQAVTFERRVLYGAWEEESGPVLEHLAWMSLGLDRNLVDEGRLSDEEEAALSAEEERIAARVKFLKKPPLSSGGKKAVSNVSRLMWIGSEIARVGAQFFVGDLLHRVLEEDEPAELARAFDAALRVAQDTGAHFLAVHQQLNKDLEKRPDKRPTREAIKGSGGILEASHTVIGVHRKGLWKSVEDDAIELIVLKQKNGPWPFSVEFDWDASRASLANGREVKYMRPGEDGADVDAFISQRSGGGRFRK